jgi:hypothetical protein
MRRSPDPQSRPGRTAPRAPRSASPRPGDEKGAALMLETAIRRLVDVVDEETTALRERRPLDLNACNTRKSQGQLELDRALRLYNGADPGEPLKAALRTLREKLETNRQVLNTHLEAVREVATLIADAIQNVESDGTYSLSFRSKGPAP